MISIIIPTNNSKKYLPRLLKTIFNQSINNIEIIVIDSSENIDSFTIGKISGLKYIKIKSDEFDHGGSRTLAGMDSNGDILVYLSQDVLFVNNYSLAKLISPLLKKNNIGATYGRQLSFVHSSPFSKFLRLFNYPDKSLVKNIKDKRSLGFKTIFFSNAFAAYRKDVLNEVGWFKKGLIFGEDTYTCAKIMKLGYDIEYISDALVYHSHNYKIIDEFRRYFDIGVFHNDERWLLDEFGKTQDEGLNYFISEIFYLVKRGEVYLIPEMLLRNLSKLLGYKLGYNYYKLSRELCKKFSMNKMWWSK